ncbi:branched-chain amino acid ABC transporter permease [Alcaligenes sp. HPC1271]|nr:branched-chain amino acid ABC transporter permease [Alcaligenes sp. HPC1271]
MTRAITSPFWIFTSTGWKKTRKVAPLTRWSTLTSVSRTPARVLELHLVLFSASNPQCPVLLSLLMLAGLGLSLVLSLMNFINLTHGSFFLLGGYISVQWLASGAPGGWPFPPLLHCAADGPVAGPLPLSPVLPAHPLDAGAADLRPVRHSGGPDALGLQCRHALAHAAASAAGRRVDHGPALPHLSSVPDRHRPDTGLAVLVPAGSHPVGCRHSRLRAGRPDCRDPGLELASPVCHRHGAGRWSGRFGRRPGRWHAVGLPRSG